MTLQAERIQGGVISFVSSCLDKLAGYRGPEAALIDRVAALGREFLEQPQVDPGKPRNTAPVTRWLGPAIGNARKEAREPADRQLLDSIEILMPHMNWDIGYDGPGLPPGFRENFGYSFLVGEGALAQSRRFAAGVTLMGPDLYYPWHQHPAEEFYINLSPGTLWGLDFGALEQRAFGEVIVHPGEHPHAMHSGDAPFLAPWLWCGAIESPARMSGEGVS